MPQDFRHTLRVLDAERPFAAWGAMALGAVGLGLWLIWAGSASLPQRLQAVEVRQVNGVMEARFPGLTQAPDLVQVQTADGEQTLRVLSARMEGGQCLLRLPEPAKPVTAVSLTLPATSPAHLILASLGFTG